MKQKRYWLRGGILGVLLLFIPSLALVLVGGGGLLVWIATPIGLLFGLHDESFYNPRIIGLFPLVVIFATSSLVGYIYGKIRNHNETT